MGCPNQRILQKNANFMRKIELQLRSLIHLCAFNASILYWQRFWTITTSKLEMSNPSRKIKDRASRREWAHYFKSRKDTKVKINARYNSFRHVDKPVTFNSCAHISWQIKLMNQKSICEKRKEVRFLKKSTSPRRDASRISCLIWIFPTRFKVMYFPISTLLPVTNRSVSSRHFPPIS